MKINIYQIIKKTNDNFEPLVKEYIKMSSKYAKVEVHTLFNKHISKAQTLGQKESEAAYNELFIPKLESGYNIALDVLGKKVDSFKFSHMISDHNTINFFIGGAYGFNKEFLSKCDAVISLSDMTMAHKIANIVLCEQIFRALCIKHNHPYHK
ncbi:MAG: 23S rRNA (pseudouridine(1915)-N(3))-methyltransferase RlmH [Campylobacterota bacterium]|nr:23S rRNA (pseudouridine(1915)-N(3))-methyltransferase RlmH [Campylobacterota bacterium]